MKSSTWAATSGCFFLALGGFLLFSGLMLIGGSINAMGPVTLLAIPEVVVGSAMLLPRYRRRGLIAGIVVGIGLTAFWTYLASYGLGDPSNALGTTVAVFPLLGAAATLAAIASLALSRREARNTNGVTRARDIARR